jgi:hypothetical protein
MLYAKINTDGVDIPIGKLQSDLYNHLLEQWGLTNTDFYSFPRCYRTKTSDGWIAENYEGNNRYKEVYLDSKLKASFFFGEASTVKVSNYLETDIHVVFFVNTSALKPTITHRADEEIRNDVARFIYHGRYNFSLTSIETGIDTCLREYPGSRREKRLEGADMHPFHCFRLNLKLTYNILMNCTQ